MAVTAVKPHLREGSVNGERRNVEHRKTNRYIQWTEEERAAIIAEVLPYYRQMKAEGTWDGSTALHRHLLLVGMEAAVPKSRWRGCDKMTPRHMQFLIDALADTPPAPVPAPAVVEPAPAAPPAPEIPARASRVHWKDHEKDAMVAAGAAIRRRDPTMGDKEALRRSMREALPRERWRTLNTIPRYSYAWFVDGLKSRRAAEIAAEEREADEDAMVDAEIRAEMAEIAPPAPEIAPPIHRIAVSDPETAFLANGIAVAAPETPFPASVTATNDDPAAETLIRKLVYRLTRAPEEESARMASIAARLDTIEAATGTIGHCLTALNGLVQARLAKPADSGPLEARLAALEGLGAETHRLVTKLALELDPRVLESLHPGDFPEPEAPPPPPVAQIVYPKVKVAILGVLKSQIASIERDTSNIGDVRIFSTEATDSVSTSQLRQYDVVVMTSVLSHATRDRVNHAVGRDFSTILRSAGVNGTVQAVKQITKKFEDWRKERNLAKL